ncbi:5360_t:CDS:2 [Acaulospora morrowiae]|uniref:5360_t:CDS:1 n=1 Tax=Acaulospora morrowiae TaxID=94023 RepID=A0A9N8V9A9_9GLOM|nr:5360_t:CDS:2 [Acaulospora morrowiae]
MVIEALSDDDFIIGNNEIVVEIDESKFSRRKETEGIWVIDGIERTDKRKCFFKW